MLIRLVLLAAIFLVALLALRAPEGARHLALRRVAMCAFGLLAALSVLFPDAWTVAAGVLGVGRGTDLLVYLLVLAFLTSVISSFRRTRALEMQITQLARWVALEGAPHASVPDVTTAVQAREDHAP